MSDQTTADLRRIKRELKAIRPREREAPVSRVLTSDSRPPGRPRTTAPRCYCGMMTAKLATVRGHHCEPGYVVDRSQRYARRARTELNCWCGAMAAKEAYETGHRCSARDVQALAAHYMAFTGFYLGSTLQALRESRKLTHADVADLAGKPWTEADAERWENQDEAGCATIDVLQRLAVVYGFRLYVEFRLPGADAVEVEEEEAQADEGEEPLT